jgi:hypothetical protein
MRKLIITIIVVFFGQLLSAEGWRSGAPLNIARYGATAVTLNNQIYVIGGATNNGQWVTVVERYDPVTQSWDANSVAPLTTPRIDPAAVVINGRIYLMGGFTNNWEETDEVDVYDPGNNSWGSAQTMRKKRRGHVALPIWQTVCVVGGIKENEFLDKAEYLNFSDDKWEDVDANLNILRYKPFAASKGSKMYVFGGIFNFPTQESYVGEVDADWNITWNALPNLPERRGNGATAILGDSIYIFGGVDNNNNATAKVDLFDIPGNRFLPLPDMPTPRISPTSAVLGNDIFVIGGYTTDINAPLSVVEIYNPGITAIEPETALPIESFALVKGYPNPFNGIINLDVSIARSSDFQLAIYDITGRLVTQLHNGKLSTGAHHFQWRAIDQYGNNVGSGIYFAILKSGSNTRSLKIVYVR